MRGTATAHAAASTANWISGKARLSATFSCGPRRSRLLHARRLVDDIPPSRRTSVGDHVPVGRVAWRPGCSSSGAAATPWCRSRSCARAVTRSPGASHGTARQPADLDRVGVGVLGTDGDLAALVADGIRRACSSPSATTRPGSGCRRPWSRQADRWCAPSARPPSSRRRHDVDDGVLVMPGAVVNAVADLERGVIVNTHASVDHGCRIGAFAHVAPGVAIAGDVTVGEGALVGIGASVAPGRCIGAWATVGAGASVVRDVAPGETVVGVPARPLRPGHRLERPRRASSWCAPATSAARRWSRPCSAATWPQRASMPRSSSAGLAAPPALQPDRRLRRVAGELGVDVDEHRSRLVSVDDLRAGRPHPDDDGRAVRAGARRSTRPPPVAWSPCVPRRGGADRGRAAGAVRRVGGIASPTRRMAVRRTRRTTSPTRSAVRCATTAPWATRCARWCRRWSTAGAGGEGHRRAGSARPAVATAPGGRRRRGRLGGDPLGRHRTGAVVGAGQLPPRWRQRAGSPLPPSHAAPERPSSPGGRRRPCSGSISACPRPITSSGSPPCSPCSC